MQEGVNFCLFDGIWIRIANPHPGEPNQYGSMQIRNTDKNDWCDIAFTSDFVESALVGVVVTAAVPVTASGLKGSTTLDPGLRLMTLAAAGCSPGWGEGRTPAPPNPKGSAEGGPLLAGFGDDLAALPLLLAWFLWACLCSAWKSHIVYFNVSILNNRKAIFLLQIFKVCVRCSWSIVKP